MLQLANLETARSLMLEEVERDIAAGTLYRSPRLTEEGWAQYADLLREAVQSHNDEWLKAQIGSRGLIKSHEQRRTKTGFTMVKVPYTAAETLAEGEFNRYYVRGVCRLVLEQDADQVTIYRAKAVEQPRYESEMRIGKKIGAQVLLDDLRATSNANMNTALGVPAGPNSGLSVRWP